MRKSKLIVAAVFLFVLVAPLAQADLIVEYREEVTGVPGMNKTLRVSVTNQGDENVEMNLTCSSDLMVNCPGGVRLEPGKEKNIFLRAELPQEPGSYPVNFELDGERGSITIVIKNTSREVRKIINYYNRTLASIERRAGGREISVIGEARASLKTARELYRDGLYTEANEKLVEVKNKTNQAAQEVAQKKVGEAGKGGEEEGVAKETAEDWTDDPKIMVVPLVAALLGGLVLFNRLRGGTVEFKGDLFKVKNAIGKVESEEEISAIKGKIERGLDLDEVEKEIRSLEESGKNVEELKLMLKHAKEKEERGLKNLSRRILAKIKRDLEEI